jgi:uncharacterized protein YjbI with pentapeptide repeats/uncharacterized RDD family membrane protein YckC
MANPSIKNERRLRQKSNNPAISVHPRSSISFLSRRLAAWLLEVSIVAGSAAVPFAAGVYLNDRSNERVPLNPALVNVQNTASTILDLPRSTPNAPPVAPATNILWWIALGSPLLISASQIYLLAKTGQTLPKRWLGIKIVSSGGQPPLWLRTGIREGLGRWGLPLGSAFVLWRYAIGFPNIGILLGMGTVLVIAETGMLLFNPRWRSFHDRISGTVAIDTRKQKASKNNNRSSNTQDRNYIPPIAVEVQDFDRLHDNRFNGMGTPQTVVNPYYNDPMSAIVIDNSPHNPKFNLWFWMRQHPIATLLIIASASVGSVLAAFVGTQIYVQHQADRRQSQSENSQVFMSLIEQLSGTATDPLQERKSLVLALARVDDPRAVPYLVDLLAQEKDPQVIESIEQALVSIGTKALNDLRRLNQSLEKDLQDFSNEDNSEEKRLFLTRLKTTKTTIAKILTIYSGQLNKVNLHHIDLSSDRSEFGTFESVLDRLDLSGLNLRSANLTEASLNNAFFSSAGKDKRTGTSDDAIADLSGAELKAADLSNSQLIGVSLQRANLILANLSDSNLSNARIQDANLSSSKLVGTNLEGARLTDSSLTGADLRDVKGKNIDLNKANLGRVKARGGDFTNGNLAQSNWQEADLSNTIFINASLQQADFNSSQLKEANLSRSQLQNANLSNANLHNADLRGANLDGANFQGTILSQPNIDDSGDGFIQTADNVEGAKVKGVDFNQVQNLDDKQIEYICSQGGIYDRCNGN